VPRIEEVTMARISLDPPRGVLLRVVEAYSRRRYGKVLDPVRVFGHQTQILLAYLRFEQKVAKWDRLDAGLKHLAETVAAARIGCEWCMDFGYWQADDLGLPLDKVAKVPAWREHREAFTGLEQQVMEYAEAMTATPPAVTDEQSARLRRELGDAALVELTTMVALENLRSRVNGAFGLTGQGFAEQCEIRPVP
jgi:alkylhydroperoxidase family enzyme